MTTTTRTQRPRYRVGIDVGGTFTHAVAVQAGSQAIAGQAKVPTTHHAATGVGAGVVQALQALMAGLAMDAGDIVCIAHSTTQATNALLEGDVEPVAIVSAGRGWHGWLARRAGRLGKVPLAGGRALQTVSCHLDLDAPDVEPRLEAFLDRARADGYRAVVVTAPFSVEDPAVEAALAATVRDRGFLCTATHEVSRLYGIRIRTRTTVINASILPKMLDVADHTERGIRRLGVAAPLLIMRSDGGVMSIEEMRKRPILTLLSGPAAGIAAALRYLEISDGVFLEVGGTSTDISVIRNGRAVTRSAQIGGNRTFLRTLDCRTIGVGGGSIPRVANGRVVDVGPRSAHIAAVRYAAFDTPAGGAAALRPVHVQPKPGDPHDYLVFEGDGPRVGFTPTCAANVLGLVDDADCARAAAPFPGGWEAPLEAAGVGSLGAFSEQVLRATSARARQTVERLLLDYRLDRSLVTLVGGGGGAAAIVPHLAKTMNMRFAIAQHHDVISAIGVALGLIREVVEKSCVNPTPDDLYRIRADARDAVVAQGADPATVEVFIEVDQRAHVIRAEAQGAIAFRAEGQGPGPGAGTRADEELAAAARAALALADTTPVRQRASTGPLTAFGFAVAARTWFGGHREAPPLAAVTDRRGVVRLRLKGAEVFPSSVASVVADLRRVVAQHSTYGDSGVVYPFVIVLVADRLIDLSKLQNPEQFAGVLELEIRDVPPSEPAVILVSEQAAEDL